VNPRLSVVIPAYNEALRLPGTLRHVLGYLSGQAYPAEVLVVDDGSRDHTADVVRTWPQGRIPVKLVEHPDRSNHGKGASVRRGILEATGDFRLFMDADNSTTVDQVDRFWPLFEQGYDLLIGSRKTAGAHVAVHQPFYKEFAGRMGNLVIQAFAVPGVIDTQAGFKIFSRRSVGIIFPRLTIDRWGHDIEILVIARVHGLRFREVPIIWVDSAGSKVSWQTYFQVLSEVWRIRRNRSAGRYA
jgi:dolichyl-phosphate beta-glucosyltransferase